MNPFITVTLISTAVTHEDDGDSTTATTQKSYDAVRFAPRSSTERRSDSPAVITAASLYRRGDFPVKPQDTIQIADQSPHADGTWQVDGEVGQWTSGVEVAIKRVGAAG